MPESHKQRTLRGINWNFLRVFSQTSLGLVVGVILARLLPPSDFGLLAVAMVFISFAELVSDLGMGSSIIRLKEIEEAHIRIATTFSLVMGSLLVVLIWSIAETAADFFGRPQVADMLRVLSVGLWFTSLSAVSRGLLLRRLDFKYLVRVDISAYLLGYAGVAVSLALAGFGVWSLVLGSTASALVTACALFYLSPPKLAFRLPRREAKDLLGFGSGMSLIVSINFLSNNVDSLIIGRFLNPALLGLYTRAMQLCTLPLNRIAATLSAVMFPSFAEIRDERERLKEAYLKVVNLVALISFPLLAGLAMGAKFVILGLYGENWQGATSVLRILSLAGMIKVVTNMAAPVVQATGHPYAEVRRQILSLLVMTVGCLGLVRYGIEGAGWAVVISSLVFYLSMAQLAGRILRSSWQEFVGAQLPGLAVAAAVVLGQILVMAVLSRTMAPLPATIMLVILVAVSAIASLLCVLYLPVRIIGKMPAWLALNYGHHAPPVIRGWLLRRFQ